MKSRFLIALGALLLGLSSCTGFMQRAVAGIEKTGTEGNVDTYTITYTDGTTETFTVTNGTDGEDGVSPTVEIGENGNWYIDGKDTGIAAEGPQGPQGETGPQGPEGEQGPQGEAGDTPYIGENGNWWVDGKDTGTAAQGPQGEGSTIEIGSNGNWWIDGVDSGVSAYGSASVCTVTLDPRGGTMPAGSFGSYEVKFGATIPSLPEPEKEGYEFLGWYTGEGENDGKFTTTTPVTGDLNLIAKWDSIEEYTYTITWVDYDMTVLDIDRDVNAGEMPHYNGQEPEREPDVGVVYTFAGWTPEIEPVSSDAVYMATYEAEAASVLVSFDIGEYGSLDQSQFAVPYGGTVDEPEIDKSGVPANYGFVGWYLDPGFAEPASFPFDVTEDTTFYGRWEEASDQLTFYYDSTYDGYVVRSYNERVVVDSVVVPSSYDDGVNGEKPVVGIQSAFSSNKSVKSIVLPEGIRFIGDRAFYGSSVESVNFPSSLEEIGPSAFESSNIKTSDLSATSIAEIPESAFRGSQLENISLPESLNRIGDNAFGACRVLSIWLPEGLISIGDFAFTDCHSLRNISVPNGLQSIGDGAFYNCWALESFSLPEGLISIGESAFGYCFSLRNISVPNGLQSIGVGAFFNCSALESFSLPDGLKRIEDSTFSGCSSLKSIALPEGLEYIGSEAFSNCDSLNSIVIPSNVQTVRQDAFANCSSLTIYSMTSSKPEGWEEDGIGNGPWYGTSPVYWYSEENPGNVPGNFWHYDEEGLPTEW